jgi:lipopolysaccharide transport system ATP-binding protein
MSRIEISNAFVDFPAFAPDRGSLKSYWTRMLGAQATSRLYIRALKSITLEINSGERVGLVGSNGSGKTTLLKLVSGIYPPRAGRVVVEGRLSPLLDLAIGFDPESSGRENIDLRLMFLGYSRAEIEDRRGGIIDFAQLGQFIDQPVKTYSSGMFLRLAFAVSTCIEPEILILDEFLSAGDLSFIRRAEARMDELMSAGKIVLIASHAVDAISARCTRAIWLRQGEVALDGDAAEVVKEYQKFSAAST